MGVIDAFKEDPNDGGEENGRYLTMRHFKTELRAFKWEIRFLIAIALIAERVFGG